MDSCNLTDTLSIDADQCLFLSAFDRSLDSNRPSPDANKRTCVGLCVGVVLVLLVVLVVVLCWCCVGTVWDQNRKERRGEGEYKASRYAKRS